jgi:hypothetical protein
LRFGHGASCGQRQPRPAMPPLTVHLFCAHTPFPGARRLCGAAWPVWLVQKIVVPASPQPVSHACPFDRSLSAALLLLAIVSFAALSPLTTPQDLGRPTNWPCNTHPPALTMPGAAGWDSAARHTPTSVASAWSAGRTPTTPRPAYLRTSPAGALKVTFG